GRSRWIRGAAPVLRHLLVYAWFLLLPTACGSGNLGKVVDSQALAPPPASMQPAGGAGAIDAGAPHVACGDGVLQTARGEQCDGTDYGGLDCQHLGLGDGVLGCDPVTCQLVTTQCAQSGAPVPTMDA